MRAVTYTIKHDIKAIGSTIELLINTIQTEHILNDQILFEIKVVLNELINNALCHGNSCELNKATYVTCKLLKDNLYICVKDEGSGFNHKCETNSVEQYIEFINSTFSEHGRGLIIVEQLCDKVRFNICGNKVSIIKNLN